VSTRSTTLLHPLLTRIRGGTLEVVDPAGVERFGDPSGVDPLAARVVVHDRRLAGRLLREHSIGLGESYADGWWDTDDLTAVLRLAHRSLSRTHAFRDAWARLVRPVADPLASRRPADPQRDAHNVRSHYDLGNELFATLLDPSMMYSSAFFESTAVTLEAASRAKLERIARRLELSPTDHVLEIGTGLGGFAVFAASTVGCRVTTTTISAEQYEFARRQVHDAGLDHLVTVRFDDYRDLDGTFDKVVAIEMIEAVDWREYESFFGAVRHLLADDGLAVLQAIVVPDGSFDRTKRRTDFIKAAIFPGGCLPSQDALTRAAGHHELRLTGSEEFGLHYAETLRRWRANLHSGRTALAARGYDERFVRLWDFYFAYCEAGFEERYISVVHLAYAAPGRRIPTHRSSDPAATTTVAAPTAAVTPRGYAGGAPSVGALALPRRR
jgi:cyclopropane-fatty-acyl-phospholipid synthase